MKKDAYKIKSYNTLEHAGEFHDSTITQVEWENDNLFLYFDWVAISYTHPNNDTGQFIETDALVCFENVKITKTQWHDDSKATANALEKKKKSGDTSVCLHIEAGEIEIKDIDFFEAFSDLFIFSLNTEKNGETYICKINGDKPPEWQNRQIEFEYIDAYICFNK